MITSCSTKELHTRRGALPRHVSKFFSHLEISKSLIAIDLAQIGSRRHARDYKVIRSEVEAASV